MTVHTPSRPPRRAFTLVEMLVVIVIIGILAGLMLVAFGGARKRARVATQKIEIDQLALAMESYKDKFGEYPPCLWDPPSVERHLRKAFPRYRIHSTTAPIPASLFDQFVRDLNNTVDANSDYGLVVGNMDPASALVFWLGGLPEAIPAAGETWAPAGFSANPANPFEPGTSRVQKFYDFQPDSTRLIRTANGALRFYPSGITTAPYVYFRARRDATTGRMEYGAVNGSGDFQPYQFTGSGNANNICVPYLDWQEGDAALAEGSVVAATPTTTPVQGRRWRNPESFQIISPGLDGQYGFWNPAVSPPPPDVQLIHVAFDAANPYWYRYSHIAVNFTPRAADRDNIANFSEGALEDERID